MNQGVSINPAAIVSLQSGLMRSPASDRATENRFQRTDISIIEVMMRFLIADDDLTNRKLLTTMLEDIAKCDVAVNGQEAVDLFRSGLGEISNYDVIFLDIKMPVMDGHEALKQIRAIEESKGIFVGDGVKIVMVTALGDKKNILDAFHEGCEYYLVKPFQQKKILELLTEMKLLEQEV